MFIFYWSFFCPAPNFPCFMSQVLVDSGDSDQPQMLFSKVQLNPAGGIGVDVDWDGVVEAENSGFWTQFCMSSVNFKSSRLKSDHLTIEVIFGHENKLSNILRDIAILWWRADSSFEDDSIIISWQISDRNGTLQPCWAIRILKAKQDPNLFLVWLICTAQINSQWLDGIGIHLVPKWDTNRFGLVCSKDRAD